MFLDNVQEFSKDLGNVADIKARSFCFAERCEALLQEVTKDKNYQENSDKKIHVKRIDNFEEINHFRSMDSCESAKSRAD